MPTFTEVLNLRKPEENDYYNEQTEQAENWQKVDDYAKKTNNDKLDKGTYLGDAGDLKAEIDTNKSFILSNLGELNINYIQTPGTKYYGGVYYDKYQNPPVPYFCNVIQTNDTTLTSNFESLRNRDICGRVSRMQKTYVTRSYYVNNKSFIIPEADKNFAFAIIRLIDEGTQYFWTTHTIINEAENWVLRALEGKKTNIVSFMIKIENSNLYLYSDINDIYSKIEKITFYTEIEKQ